VNIVNCQIHLGGKDMRNIKCPICGKEVRFTEEKNGYRFYHCKECKTKFMVKIK